MKVSVIGTGYVGLVSGVCLAEIGHDVTCIDIDENKINKLRSGRPTIYENGLEELMKKNILNDRLHFTSDYEVGLKDAHVILIAVGTPSLPSGKADLRYIEESAIAISNHISRYTVVVTKSTVPVGTNEWIKDLITANLKSQCEFDVVSNPEFLREGSAVQDTFHGDRIIIGSSNKKAADIVASLYEKLNIPIVHTDVRSAEMIKYASNAFLSTKISFINEIANICEKLGADIESVALGMGMDSRIGSKFLQAGIGYGGSCFPKDTKALVQIAGHVDHEFDLLKSVINVNNKQQIKMVEKAVRYFGDKMQNVKIALLGLAYKPNTDDIREAASVKIIEKLMEYECEIRVYDPVAMPEFQKQYTNYNVVYCKSWQEAIDQADCLMIVTEWEEFKQMDLALVKNLLVKPVIFDGRNCLKIDAIKKLGFEYFSIGRKDITTEC